MAQHAVTVTKQQQKMIDRLIETGRFHGANEVIATGLRLLEEREKQASAFIGDLEDEIAKGLQSGPSAEMESSAELLAEFRRTRD